MPERLTFSALVESPPQPNLSCIAVVETQITPLASLSDRENKREYSEAMDVEEGEASQTPKKKKIEEPDEITSSAGAKGKNKIVKVKAPSFMIQEYTFSSVPKEVAGKNV